MLKSTFKRLKSVESEAQSAAESEAESKAESAATFTMVKNSTAEANLSNFEGTVKNNWYVIFFITYSA